MEFNFNSTNNADTTTTTTTINPSTISTTHPALTPRSNPLHEPTPVPIVVRVFPLPLAPGLPTKAQEHLRFTTRKSVQHCAIGVSMANSSGVQDYADSQSNPVEIALRDRKRMLRVSTARMPLSTPVSFIVRGGLPMPASSSVAAPVGALVANRRSAPGPMRIAPVPGPAQPDSAPPRFRTKMNTIGVNVNAAMALPIANEHPADGIGSGPPAAVKPALQGPIPEFGYAERVEKVKKWREGL